MNSPDSTPSLLVNTEPEFMEIFPAKEDQGLHKQESRFEDFPLGTFRYHDSPSSEEASVAIQPMNQDIKPDNGLPAAFAIAIVSAGLAHTIRLCFRK